MRVELYVTQPSGSKSAKKQSSQCCLQWVYVRYFLRLLELSA